jgi:hypothetical protein
MWNPFIKQGVTIRRPMYRYAVNGLKWLLIFACSSVITVLILMIIIKSMSWWYVVEYPYVSNQQIADGGFDLAGAGSVFLFAFLIMFFIWVLSTWITYKVLKNYF